MPNPFAFRRWTSSAILAGVFSGCVALSTVSVNMAAPAPPAHTPAPSATQTEMVPMKLLKVIDTIYLPTVSSERRLEFTKPKTWSLLPTSKLHLEFQHSHELLPHRSWLKVLVNEQVIIHIPLTKANAEGTAMDIPLPIGNLRDVNTLRYRVEQHYTDICEDPLEPSLWTQILPTTRLVFNYNPALPNVNLAQYPYPMIDPLTYSAAKIQYVTPQYPAIAEAQAMTLVNLSLAQAAQKKEMMTDLSNNGRVPLKSGEHLVVVGTPVDNPKVVQYASGSGQFSVQGKTWVDKRSGQPVGDNEGVVIFMPDPAVKSRAVLVVSGNSPEGVLKAAQYVSTPKVPQSTPGNGYLVSSSWHPDGGGTQRKPRYVDSQNRTFAELELITEPDGYQEVHKIYAPPLTYKVPVVGDFRKAGSKLFLDLVYSYGPGMNPEYSSLEIRMNGVPIGNIPLLDPNGESNRRATVPISNELIHPRNELVAQFHMLPDKFGRCKNTFTDKAWGRLHKDSQFRVEGGVSPRLPDLIYMGDIGYPYSKKDNLEETHIVVPKQASPAVLKALLAFTTRLGRNLKSDTDFRLTMSEAGSALPGNRDIVSFSGQGTDAVLTGNIGNQFLLSWPLVGMKPLLKEFKNSDDSKSRIQDDGMSGYMEQRTNPGTDRMITTLSAKKDAGLNGLAALFEDDEAAAWEKLTSGSLKQLASPDLNHNEMLTSADYPTYHIEQERSPLMPQRKIAKDTGWFSSISTVQFLLIFCGLFLLLIIFPIVSRKLFDKRR